MNEQKKEQKPGPRLMVRGLGLVLVAVAALLVFAVPSRAGDPACQSPLEPGQRHGFVVLSANWQQEFDTTQLNAGWYVDFSARYHSAPPQGLDRALMIRVYPGYTVDAADLGPTIDRYPGATWLVGNEPDDIWQDDVLPEEYARIYHDLHTFIKNRDRTSQVAAGGIVQPTPLRLEYLDRVLAAYQARYGRAMPVDVWHIHNAILNEVSCAYDAFNCWGAEIPPGIDAPYGEIRAISDNDNMTLFADQIWAFRRWMAGRGYAGYPLIVTEYGILMPAEYGFGVDRVNAFMSATFAFFESTADAHLGDPTDGGRLVQRWAWFSLTDHTFNGNLFDPATAAITEFGQHYKALTTGFPPLSYTDLSVSAIRVPASDVLASSTQTISRSLGVRVANIGTAAAGSFAVDLAYAGSTSGALQETIESLAPLSARWITFTVSNLPPGGYNVSVAIDPGGDVVESLECNNTASATLLAPSYRLHLPLVTKAYAAEPPARLGSRSEPVVAMPQQVGETVSQRVGGGGLGLPNLLGVSAQSAMSERQLASSPWLTSTVPTGGSYPAQIDVAEDGTVWISERDGNKVAQFDPQTRGWQEFGIPTAAGEPWGIALDGDGNVWLAETAADKIAMLDVAGGTFDFVEYDLPPGSEPWDVAVAGDGAIWFSARARNEIGKLVPGGTPVWYGGLTPGAGPAGLGYYGGYVYFAEPAGDRIARLTVSLPQVNESFRGTGSEPQDVALTPSGAPWFVETGANRIFLLDPSTLGMGCTVPVRTPDSEPYGIATDGNSRIWFTERAGNKLGLYRHPLGKCSFHYEFPLPIANSQPTGIAVDGDGCAWFTAPGANYIGRYCLTLTRTYLPVALKNGNP